MLTGKSVLPPQNATNRVRDNFEVIDLPKDSKWEKQVHDSAQSTFFHTTSWMRILQSSYGYRPMLARLIENGETTLSLPIMEVKSPFTGNRGISLPFTDECQPLGPHPERREYLLRGLQDLAKRKAWKYMELRGILAQDQPASPSTQFYSHTLHLNYDTDALFRNMSDSTRRAIRKSKRESIELSDSSSEASLIAFYKLIQATRKRHGLPPQPFSFFEHLFEEVLRKGKGQLILAQVRGKFIAGALFLHHRKNVIFKFGASEKRYQSLRANNLIMWSVIQRYAQEGYETFNFGRTSIDNHGLRQFKRGWGADETVLFYHKYDPFKNRFLSENDKSSGWHTKLFRLMPIPMLKLVGSLIYKHIA